MTLPCLSRVQLMCWHVNCTRIRGLVSWSFTSTSSTSDQSRMVVSSNKPCKCLSSHPVETETLETNWE